ncbi:hypothetical protein DICPUDRAFT_27302 [Dictyostelium purpureum]|uniref:Signal recognition particle 19 kDa protein n=1 Tax=Dictyostelium purpureum TaxID=5786 RepID=F0Z9Y9_DICPU|nr:uncharacterized protein DICPUDRAFT_27302 [Dictyostelium purpureum]EGC39235.1 hypothetical protein DICPUDRAFT_27302 [Dictyostelium purpureum]|eukprot:XP_003284262.1 hypothetical protein DICPUDRAFT_27302 [Dictyostelium purpureum]
MSTPTPTPTPAPTPASLTQPKQVDITRIPGFKQWVIIYPPYINSECTKDRGRKISKENAVKNPNLIEIAEATSAIGFSSVIEPNKGYPKEFFQRGRVRINFEELKHRYPAIKNKTILMCKIAEIIKKNQPNRPESFNPLSLLPPVQAVSNKEKKHPTPNTTTTTTTTSSSSSKTGGKKKKNVNVI